MVAVAGVVFRLRPIRLFELGLLIPDQPVWAVAGLEPGLIVSPPFPKRHIPVLPTVLPRYLYSYDIALDYVCTRVNLQMRHIHTTIIVITYTTRYSVVRQFGD